MRTRVRLLGGLGTTSIVYGSLRVVEKYPAIFFISLFLIVSYGLGFLLDRSEET